MKTNHITKKIIHKKSYHKSKQNTKKNNQCVQTFRKGYQKKIIVSANNDYF
jgi:hypothetical protein